MDSNYLFFGIRVTEIIRNLIFLSILLVLNNSLINVKGLYIGIIVLIILIILLKIGEIIVFKREIRGIKVAL